MPSLQEHAKHALDELAWWSFFLPRQGVQTLARRLPLAELRDRLPRFIGRRLRAGLYPARVKDPQAVTVERRQPAWGEPAELDRARPIRYAEAPRASLLMVTFGNLGLTRLCLASLQRAAGALPFELIVVDNASPDGSATWLRETEASGLLPLRLIANPSNAGFAAANNQAARSARGDTLVFLNNDTVVTPGWLEHLVGHLDRDARLGLVGPVTNSCGNEAEVPIDYRDLEGMFAFAERYTRTHTGERVELPMLTLFCAAMPRTLFEQIGGLDERYRVGMFEDDDLAMAVRTHGRAVMLARDVFVHHYGGAAFLSLPPERYLRIWWENRRQFERKWRVRWQKR
jgi:GT2 family glycosyltransferase